MKYCPIVQDDTGTWPAPALIHDMLGYNYRMTDIAAAIGICQLKQLDEANTKKIKECQVFDGELRQN